MKYASLLVLLASAAVAYPCVRAWFSPVSIRAVTESVKASLREGKYVASVLLLLSSVMDGILERKSSDRRAVWRFRVFSLAVLLAALSICDLMYGTLLGMKETPWASYDRTVAIVASSLDRPLSAKDSRSAEMVRVHSEYQRAVHSAQQLPWKYVYTGAVICLIVFTNWFFLLMSLLLARHVVAEISAPISWMARLGLLVVLLLGSAVLAMSCAVCVGLLTSPVLWVVLVLAKVFGSAAVLVLGLFGALVFDWLLSGPLVQGARRGVPLAVVVRLAGHGGGSRRYWSQAARCALRQARRRATARTVWGPSHPVGYCGGDVSRHFLCFESAALRGPLADV